MGIWHDIMEENSRHDEIMDEAEIWANMLLEEKIEALKKKIKEEVKEEVKKEAELETYNSSSESSYTPSSSSYSIPTQIFTTPKKKKAGFFTFFFAIFFFLCAGCCIALIIAAIDLNAELGTDFDGLVYILIAFTFLFAFLSYKILDSKVIILKSKKPNDSNSHKPVDKKN